NHMQVRAANGTGRQPDNGVLRVFDLWFRNVIQTDVAYSMKYNCLHNYPPKPRCDLFRDWTRLPFNECSNLAHFSKMTMGFDPSPVCRVLPTAVAEKRKAGLEGRKK